MYSLCDVNFILNLVHDRQSHHKHAKEWMEGRTERAEVGITRSTQVAVLRLLNNPAVMGVDVCDGRAAWAVMDELFEDRRMVLLADPPDLDQRLREFTMKIKYSPKVWSDAFLAAFALAAGRRLVTFDQGFRAYRGLDVEVLGSL